MSEDAKKKVAEMIAAIGAFGEILGETRRSFERNGFTRDESIALCIEVLRSFFSRTSWED